MTQNNYRYAEPKLLFELWKELTGEDLLTDLPNREESNRSRSEDINNSGLEKLVSERKGENR